MASRRLAHKLFFLANCMPAAKRQAVAAAIKGTDAGGAGKAAEYCSLRSSGHQHQRWPHNKARTMATAAQELSHEEMGGCKDLLERGGGRRGFLFRGRRHSPLVAFDLFDSFFPNRNMRSMIDSMDRVFADPFFGGSRGHPAGGRLSSRPPWDFVETEDAFRMRLDLPGLDKDEVKVYVEDGSLVIKGEHNEENKADEAQWASRSQNSHYSTRIVLPDNANAEQIKAELKNGVLTVTVPKVLHAEPEKTVIDVQIA